MKEREVIIRSKKSQEAFDSFKGKYLLVWVPLWVILGIVILGMLFTGSLFLSITNFGFLPASIVSLWASIYLLKGETDYFENVEFIVVQSGIIKLSKKNNSETFIPMTHISTIELKNNFFHGTFVRVVVDGKRMNMPFLSNAPQMVAAINKLRMGKVYSTVSNIESNQSEDFKDANDADAFDEEVENIEESENIDEAVDNIEEAEKFEEETDSVVFNEEAKNVISDNDDKGFCCPYCGSRDITPVSEVSTKGKDFSRGNACCGYMLCGPLGLLCGLSGNKQTVTTTYWMCKGCGNKFKS